MAGGISLVDHKIPKARDNRTVGWKNTLAIHANRVHSPSI
jgi:hypothetical protein